MYPYKEVEKAAKQNPPPIPPENEDFPTVATVVAFYLPWVTLFGHTFDSQDVVSNARETIIRVSRSKLMSHFQYRWRMEREPRRKKKYVALAWDSYQKNLWNTVSGTCAETLARRELGKLSPDSHITWLPSSTREIDLIHLREYFEIMTVSEAIEKGLCTTMGCKCGWFVV